MALFEKIVMLICLFGGFFWLRKRARSVNLEDQIGKSMLGVFVLLPATLIGEKYLFEHFIHFGVYTDLLLKIVVVTATFPAIGYLFLKPGDSGAALAGGEARPGASEVPEGSGPGEKA